MSQIKNHKHIRKHFNLLIPNFANCNIGTYSILIYIYICFICLKYWLFMYLIYYCTIKYNNIIFNLKLYLYILEFDFILENDII